MIDSFSVAAAGVHSKPGKTEENLIGIAGCCRKAAEQGAKLILLPELSVTGFIPNHPVGDHSRWLKGALRVARAIAQPIPGPAVAELTSIASETGLLIAAGLLEDAGNLLYNTQVLVGPEGMLGAWRKMHVPMFEMPFYNGGAGPLVAQTGIARIGANICFDAMLPESTRLLALQNVEVILFPFAADPSPCTPEGWAAWAGTTLRVRAMENGVFGIASNYTGHVECAGAEQFFPGGALVVGPGGEVIAEWKGDAGEPFLLLAELRRETLQEARASFEYTFRFRRPELYGPLARS